MDIILNTTFNNPNLPVAEVPGFRDSFNRPASESLGVTDDGKVWGFSGSSWTITERNTATGEGRAARAWVDGLSPDGILSAKVAKAASEGADKRSGLLFRYVDSDNYIFVCPNTQNVLTLYMRFEGSTVLGQSISGQTLETGDILSVEMFGSLITIRRNGLVVHTETITDLMTSTVHGFYSTSTSDTEWDSIEFVA